MKTLVYIIIGAILALNPASGFAWGEKGHNTIAWIAQAHLTPKTEREVRRLLGGHNMIYWSKWADELRDDSIYDIFSTWHYANADEGHTYATMPKNPAGDVVTATKLCIDQLSARGQSDSLRTLYLKLLIHFVGDMHCPMHTGRRSDSGGNAYPVTLFRAPATNLHRIWDSSLIDAAHAWSALEWAQNIDYTMSKQERRQLQAGTPDEWIEQSVALAASIYAGTPQDRTLSYDYVNEWSPVVESQLLKGGYRLARVLNELFDPKRR